MTAYTPENAPEPFETVYYVIDDEVIKTVYDPNDALDRKMVEFGHYYPTQAEAEATL